MHFPVTYAVLAALCAALLYVILKFFQRWKIDNLQGLTFNYITASALSFLISREENMIQLPNASAYAIPALLIGLLFIVVFNLTALTAQRSGLAVASIASKMSMAIPIVCGIFLFHDLINATRIAGILLALTAVFISGSNGRKSEAAGQRHGLLLPALLFLGSGLVDTSIKLSEHYFIRADNINLYFSFLFGSAALFGLIMLVVKYYRTPYSVPMRAVAGGILLGSVNYFSLVFLVKALASPGAESSLIFAVVNMLVVLISTVFGIFIFLEKPSWKTFSGISLALAALYILSR